MNCAECRDNMVACAEGLLDHEEELRCRAHFGICADCRVEYGAIAGLQQRLITRGQAAAGAEIVETVMRRVLEHKEPERETIMSKLLKHRWGFGLGAAAGAAAAILFIVAMTSPRAEAKAIEVMTKGAQAVAKLSSIHLRGRMRTYPAGNFSAIDPNVEFCTVELWKQFEPELKWRVEKPGRVAVMNGGSKLMFIKADNQAFQPSSNSTWDFDTEWLQRMANLGTTISNELNWSRTNGWKLELTEKAGEDGRAKSVVTVHAEFGLPEDDPLKNEFYDIADTRRVYCFDARTKLLESVQVYLRRPSGEVLIFDLGQIDYNQPLNPALWRLALPADVLWIREPAVLPDNEKYVSMTAEQAARAFLEACAGKDWNETEKFISPVTPDLKQALGGLEILSLGESYASKVYAGRFVPYVVKFPPEEVNLKVSNANAAKRYVVTGLYNSELELQDGDDLKWTNEPAILANNEAYARMSPVEVAKACADAITNLDWTELKKFCPDNYVDNNLRPHFDEAKQAGLDIHKLVQIEVVGAFWSPEKSAWFVKCRMSETKKMNLAIRKDNPAGRWQVDGGI